jgi:hypothetical protein
VRLFAHDYTQKFGSNSNSGGRWKNEVPRQHAGAIKIRADGSREKDDGALAHNPEGGFRVRERIELLRFLLGTAEARYRSTPRLTTISGTPCGIRPLRPSGLRFSIRSHRTLRGSRKSQHGLEWTTHRDSLV